MTLNSRGCRLGRVLAIFVLTVALMGGCAGQASEPIARLPREVGGWVRARPVASYDRRTLYDYIDGAAEVYLAYGFERVLSCRYHKAGQPPIVVDIFQMRDSKEAFGVFSFERVDEEAGIGQGSEAGPSLIRFWKGRYFVAVSSPSSPPAPLHVLKQVASSVADAIEEVGEPPDLVSVLPPKNLRRDRTVYFHTHSSLKYHYFISEENILQLGLETEAVLALYGSRRKDGTGPTRLLVIRYPDSARAAQALHSFLAAYLPEADAGRAARTRDGCWCAASRHGRYVAVVFEAPTRGVGVYLLDSVKKRLARREEE